jgi:hypothetical protein
VARVFLAMHVLKPELSPIRAPGSAYVLGAYGAWMTSTYFALSAALLSAAIGLVRNHSAKAMARAACTSFVVASACVALAGVFPMDYPGPPRTFSGLLHAVGGFVGFPSWILGSALFSISLRRDRRWERLSKTLLRLSVASLLAFGAMVLSINTLGFGGYIQRVMVVPRSIWMNRRRTAARSGDSPAGSSAARILGLRNRATPLLGMFFSCAALRETPIFGTGVGRS